MYRVLLGTPELPGGEAPIGPIAIESETTAEKLCFDPNAKTDNRLREASLDYAAQNSSPWVLDLESLNLGRKVDFLSSAELKSIFSSGVIAGWRRFHNEHTDVHGYVRMSAVGFSADRTFAIVDIGSFCGPTCGAGGVVTLSKRNGVWHKNRDQFCSWIS